MYHRSKNTMFDFSGPEAFASFHYAAFYADCQHEIKPVTKGHRLCLVYNLVYTGFDDCPAPENNDTTVSSVVSSLKEWSAHTDSGDCPPMMCYMLEHKYCEASLSFQLLKNTDRAVASVLMEARKEVDIDLFLGQINVCENWWAEDEEMDREPIELIQDTSEALHLRSPEGHSVPRISACGEYFVPYDFFDNIDPDKEEYEEATGNEGATLDKQYNWTAVIFWPAKLRASNMNKIYKLSLDLAAPSANKEELAEVAKVILRSCACEVQSFQPEIDAEKYESLFESLLKIGNTELVLDGLNFILGSSSSVIAEPSFADKVAYVGNTYGWHVLVAPFARGFAKVSASTSGIDHFCKFLSCILGSQPSGVRKDVCLGLGKAIINALAASNKGSFYRNAVSQETSESLFESLLKIGDAVLISKGLKSILISTCGSLPSQTSFGKKVLTVGRTFGWSVVTPPLEAGFKHLSTYYDGRVYNCKLLERIRGSQPSDVQKEVCLVLARAIISGLPVSHSASYYHDADTSYECIFESLMNIGDAALISEGLKSILVSSSSSLLLQASFCDKVLAAGCTFGWSIIKPPLEAGFKHLSRLHTDREVVDCCHFLVHILGSQPSEALKDLCVCLTNFLICALSDDVNQSRTSAESCESLLHVLLEIGDASRILDGFKLVLNSCSASLIPRESFSEKVLTIGHTCGWNVLKAPLKASFHKFVTPDSELKDYCKFLQRIYSSHSSDGQKDVCQVLVSVVVTVLSTETDTAGFSIARGKEFLYLLFQFLLTLGDNKALRSLVQIIITKPKRYPLFDTLIPLCDKFSDSGNGSLKLLFSHCIACLESNSTLPFTYDWSRPVTFSCSCRVCVKLVRFLNSSTKVKRYFKVNVWRHTHIEQQLKAKKCAVTCVTVGYNSVIAIFGDHYRLIVTKTVSARQKAAQYIKLRKDSLSRLRALAGLPSSRIGPARKQPVKKQQKPSYSSADVMAALSSSSSEPAAASVAVRRSARIEKRQKPSGEATGLRTGPSGVVHSSPAKKQRN